MALNAHCRVCLRVLWQQVRFFCSTISTSLHSRKLFEELILNNEQPLKRPTSPYYPARAKVGSRLLSNLSSAPEKPLPTLRKQPSTVEPPPRQESGAQLETPKNAGHAASSTTAQTIAAEARRVLPPSITETYVAYGSCEKLVKESARQAAYAIPQASDKSLPIPKTKDGEDLGVGESWWYQSEAALPGLVRQATDPIQHWVSPRPSIPGPKSHSCICIS